MNFYKKLHDVPFFQYFRAQRQAADLEVFLHTVSDLAV